MIIGVAGPPGSGKDTLAGYVAEHHNFTHVLTGDLLRHEADRRGLDHERATLQRLGTEMRRREGCDRLFAEVLQQAAGRVIFTGIRTLDAAELVLQHGGVMVYVDAPLEVRCERCVSRGRESEVSLEEFTAADRIEQGDATDTDLSLSRILPIARYVISNDGDIGELHQQADAIVADLDS